MNKDSTIAVFGSGGLVGGAIVRRLLADGHHPKNLLLPRSRDIDLREQEEVQGWFRVHKVDYVFLAAATVGGIMANKTRKAEFLYDNLMINSNVIDTAYYSGVKKLLFLGSSCIYPKYAEQPIQESSLLTGALEPTNDAYAIAKIAGMKMCEFYNEQYGFDAFSLMPCNMYGPGDNYDEHSGHVMGALISRFHNAKLNNLPEVVCWGDGSPLREFLYNEDLADACVYFMDKFDDEARQKSSFLNIGTGTDISIKHLAESIADVVGYTGKIVWDTSKPNGTPRKVLDTTLATELGWKPKTDFIDGLKASYNYYLSL